MSWLNDEWFEPITNDEASMCITFDEQTVPNVSVSSLQSEEEFYRIRRDGNVVFDSICLNEGVDIHAHEMGKFQWNKQIYAYLPMGVCFRTTGEGRREQGQRT